MSKPFDATTRQLIELGPVDWLEYLGLHVADPSRVTVIDSNVSTVTADADKVIASTIPLPGSSTSSSRPAATSDSRRGRTATARCCNTATRCRCAPRSCCFGRRPTGRS